MKVREKLVKTKPVPVIRAIRTDYVSPGVRVLDANYFMYSLFAKLVGTNICKLKVAMSSGNKLES